METKRSTICAILLFFGISVLAQLPPKTVVFKVRKANKNKVINAVVIRERKEDLVVEQKVDEQAGQTFQVVEENATFQGGDINTFRSWTQSHLKYPEDAFELEISGRVLVQFVVDTNGKVTDAKVLRGIDPRLDKEALRIVMQSPVWTPGKVKGKAVKQQFVISINFQLP